MKPHRMQITPWITIQGRSSTARHIHHSPSPTRPAFWSHFETLSQQRRVACRQLPIARIRRSDWFIRNSGSVKPKPLVGVFPSTFVFFCVSMDKSSSPRSEQNLRFSRTFLFVVYLLINESPAFYPLTIWLLHLADNSSGSISRNRYPH